MARDDDYSSPTRRNYLRDAGIVGSTLLSNAPTSLLQVLGPPSGRNAPLSEYRRDDERNTAWMLKYLARIWTAKTPWTGWGFFEREPMSVVPNISAHPSTTDAPGEAWFFINGILTDRKLGELNAMRLSDVFHRPITLLSNPTYNIASDLHQCINGRTLDLPSPEATHFAALIHRSLEKCERVVLVGHSQGTIIAANIVELLIRYGVSKAELRKLELYLFACAAAFIPGLGASGRTRVPLVEHFVNEHDLVAKISINYRGPEPLRLRGRVFYRPGKYGHVLNACYLDDLDAYRDVGDREALLAAQSPTSDERSAAEIPSGVEDSAARIPPGVENRAAGIPTADEDLAATRPRLLAYREGGAPAPL